MTAAEFRRIALSLAGASENSHMGHPDFRAGNKIFATLGAPDPQFAMVKLTPEQQREFVAAHPDIFSPAKGAWGRNGSTELRLANADAESVGAAITAAWRNARAKARKRSGSR